MKKVYKYNFISKFKTANILSFFLVLGSLGLIFFKGLNFGIDFKGGTLIEIRTENSNINIAEFIHKISSKRNTTLWSKKWPIT